MRQAIPRYFLKVAMTFPPVMLVCLLIGAYDNSANASGACPSTFANGEVFAIVRPLAPEHFDASVAKVEIADAMNYIEVIGGKPASPGAWPATFILCVSDQTFCTSTLVGVRVILTAAHCFDHVRSAGSRTTRGGARFGPGDPVGITCTIHPEYEPLGGGPSDPKQMQRPWSADLSICAADSDLSIGEAERLVSSGVHPVAGGIITLLGFGCTSPGGGGVVQVLYSGPSIIDDVGTSTYFIHTSRKIDGPAALCSGDSGGASFTTGGASREVNGINAIADNTKESWITDLSRPEIRQFVAQQTSDPARHVCGLHPDAKGCRPP
jgi:hypothetical protein